MKRELLEVYVCPVSHSRLSFSGAGPAELEEITEGELVSAAGAHYVVRQGVPVFLPFALLSETERETQAEYDASAEQKYDAAVDWLFRSFYENEDDVREPKKTLAEITRIVKQGGRVVFGDEALPPWLDGTEFGEMIIANNPLFKHKVPLEYLPLNAREVTLRWVLGGCFYLIDFKVGDGPPPADIDLPHKGWRGGTMRTRYYGRLEGVTPEARRMAIEAAKTQGVSVHEWLDLVVRRAARSGRRLPGEDCAKI